MNNIPIKTENPNGLHQKYLIQKLHKRTETEMQDEAEKRLSKLKESHKAEGVNVKEYEVVPVDESAEYFVMRLDTGGSDIEHIKACRIGIHAYADSIQHHLPELAKNLKERYPLL